MESLKSTPFCCPRGLRFSTPGRPFIPLKTVVRAKREIGGSGDFYGGGGGGGGGGGVDENMIVLRMRIREMEISERIHGLPSDWMEWEKKYYEQYNKDVCEAVGMLQSVFMNMRPSLGLGMVLVVALSLPISSFVVLVQVIGFAKWVLSRFLLNM